MHIKRENETEKERERSVFSTVFLALVAVLAVEIAMLLLSFTLSGFTSRLNSNAEQILDKQVVNRAAYISGQLIEAQDLSSLDSAVNRAAAQLVQEGETVASLTSSNEGSAPLFDAVSDQMVRILREKNVTGVYIVLHTGELSRTAGGSLPCLYLRDLDPSALASATNDDLLLEHAPAAVMHRMSISTSENWEPGIPVTGGAQDDFSACRMTARARTAAFKTPQTTADGRPRAIRSPATAARSSPIRSRSSIRTGRSTA